jgi:hypothetical protein
MMFFDVISGWNHKILWPALQKRYRNAPSSRVACWIGDYHFGSKSLAQD